jgi:putative transposase
MDSPPPTKTSGTAPAEADKIPWPHAPTHLLSNSGNFMLTAGTYLKRHHFRGADRLRVLQRGLLTAARDFGWQLEAWAVFSNHYHFVGRSPAEGAGNLSSMLGRLHEETAKWVNDLDGTPGRKVWHNFYETELTFQKSYFARLNYVHQNAVRHALVPVGNQYTWCSAAWFERTATRAQVKTIYRFKIDRLNILDDYEVAPEW